LFYDRIDKVLHDFQLAFFRIAFHLIDYVFQSVYEILEGHLVLIDPVAHDLDED
jgi:hypothetical protein